MITADDLFGEVEDIGWNDESKMQIMASFIGADATRMEQFRQYAVSRYDEEMAECRDEARADRRHRRTGV